MRVFLTRRWCGPTSAFLADFTAIRYIFMFKNQALNVELMHRRDAPPPVTRAETPVAVYGFCLGSLASILAA